MLFLTLGIGSILKIIGLLYVCTIIPLFIKKGNGPIIKTYSGLLILILWLWLRNIVDLQTAKSVLVPFTNNILFIVILTYHLTISDFRLLMKSLFVISVSCTMVSVLVFFNFIPSFEIIENRLVFMGMNSNDFSYLIVISILIILHFFVEDFFNQGKVRFLLLLSIPFLLFSLANTGSRGGIIILGSGIITYILFRKGKIRSKIIPLLFGIVILYVLHKYLFSFEVVKNRFIIDEDAITFGGRISIWKVALGLFIQNPLAGVDFATYQSVMLDNFGKFKSAHNAFIYILALGGILGLIFFLNFIYKAIKSCEYSVYSTFFFSLLIMQFLFLSKSGSFFGFKLMWFIFAAILAAGFAYENNEYPIRELLYDQVQNRDVQTTQN